MEIIQARIPEYWLCYLINGDCSGYEDDEIKAMERWETNFGLQVLCDVQDTDDFSLFNGLLTKTVLVNCVQR